MSSPLASSGLSCRIGGQLVVDDVSLSVNRAEWVALVGPNGAGKSTLLAALAGVGPHNRGSLTLDGRAIEQWPARDRARRLAWLAQSGDAEGDIAVNDIVQLGRLPHLGLHGGPGADDQAIVMAAMREMEVDHLAERRLAELSGGERQRVLLARVLAVQAPLLLLDEPTAHLDAPHQRALVRSVRRRVAAGDAVVTVLHDLTLALQADRILVLAQGRLQADGPPSDPMLRAALEAAFDHAFAIVELPASVREAHPRRAPASPADWPRWVAVALS
jgi:iron complex transport system ATP-binding protein